ncbi:winged helix-turn-helix domain-containing protein [Bacteroides fragilis]|nr:winged helix-turn-helix domain-containing protein [Bacteroides fragilis]
MKELCSLTCLNIDDVMLAVGWLAKENSSFIEKKADSFYVSDGSEVLLLLRIGHADERTRVCRNSYSPQIALW